MIEKIVITNKKLEPLFSNKISLLDSLDIISSIFWLGETLLYTRGKFVYYFYPFQEIEQKVFTSDQNSLTIAGVVSDRLFLICKNIGYSFHVYVKFRVQVLLNFPKAANIF